MNTRPKSVKLSDDNFVRQLLDESDDDNNSLSDFDDSDENGHYVPGEFENLMTTFSRRHKELYGIF